MSGRRAGGETHAARRAASPSPRPAGGGALGEVLGLNLGLRHLDMTSCRVGPDACLLIANGLKASLAGGGRAGGR